MKFDELVGRVTDAVSVRRVYGEPVERDGTTVIPAATVMGGGGGGGGDKGEAQDGAPAESGGGLGYGMVAWPSGAIVIEDGAVCWQRSLDVNRLVWLVATTIGLAIRARRGR